MLVTMEVMVAVELSLSEINKHCLSGDVQISQDRRCERQILALEPV